MLYALVIVIRHGFDQHKAVEPLTGETLHLRVDPLDKVEVFECPVLVFPALLGDASVSVTTWSRTRMSADRAPRESCDHSIGSNSTNTAGSRNAFCLESCSVFRFHRLTNLTPTF